MRSAKALSLVRDSLRPLPRDFPAAITKNFGCNSRQSKYSLYSSNSRSESIITIRPGTRHTTTSIRALQTLPTSSQAPTSITASASSLKVEDPPSPLPRSINPSSALLLLTIPHPPSAWPAKLEFSSPLLGLASRSLKKHGVVVNAVWDGISNSTEMIGVEDEVYEARILWPDGSLHTFERFSKETIISGEVGKIMEREVDRMRALSPDDQLGSREKEGEGKWEILVCTHGSRDCRCGETGGELVRSLREEIERRGLEGKVRVGEVAHVGGHKYAANAIVLPALDMISNLRPQHASDLISWIVKGRDKSDDMWQFWRGRYGLSETEQAGVWGSVGWAHGEEKRFEDQARLKVKQEVGEKVVLKFKTFDGDLKEVTASIGETLLIVGKREGLPAIEGVCGGKLECATCHVYIPPSAPIEEASEAELDMLGYALGYRDGESRLGCQIKVTRELADWVQADNKGVISLPRY